MTRKEIEQMHLLEKLKSREIDQESPAELLNLTTRQVRNKSKAYHLE